MSASNVIAFDDARTRERIRASLDESLIVEASAGAGKTTELVKRLVGVLASGRTRIENIVAVTFTNKAAGELKLRLRQGLDERRGASTNAGEIRNLEEALKHLEEASIGTIHSFCAQVLRQRPVEAKVDPAFEEISEQESDRLYERAFRGWMETKLGESTPGLRRAFARLAWRPSWDTTPPMEQLQFAGRKLIEWRDFPTPWRREPFDRKDAVDALVQGVDRLAALSARCRRPGDSLFRALLPARELAVWIERSETAGPRDYDTLESRLCRLHADLKRDSHKGSGAFGEGVTREEVLGARDSLISALDEFRRRADADLAALLRDEMWDLVERYDDLKRRSGQLDFVDLLILVRDLVRDNAEVRRYLQQTFTHIFVDEFQDTDPLQAEILLLLAADNPAETHWLEATPVPGKLFVVGDPKQSIYKFRRADVELYRMISGALRDRGVGFVRLTKSFRAVPSIQHTINVAFEREIPDYAALIQHRPEYGGQPAVIVLPAPRPYGSRGVTKSAIDACLPETIAAFVEWLLKESRWTIPDAEHPDRRVPLAPGHITILFRRFINFRQDLTRPYTRSLEVRGIPHLLVGSKSFHKREEVETLRAALTAIEWPDDELSVYATLRGSLFAIRDGTLLRFRREIGHLHPFVRFPDALEPEFVPVRDALTLLKDLHRGRNRRPFAETVNELLETTRTHGALIPRPAGHQVLANVYRVRDLARNYELGGGISFRGFVEELAAEAEKAQSAEAPVHEEGAGGVRLMTVHTAKGLEFPVVILADMTANLAAQEPDRYVDPQRRVCAMRLLRCAPQELLDHEAEERERERAEGVRVAYVAATRARDLLVVPAAGDGLTDPWLRESWLAPLNGSIYPNRETWRHPEPDPRCPRFGDTTVLSRPIEMDRAGDTSVRPGLHKLAGGLYSLVWWDPGALNLSVDEAPSLAAEEIFASGPNSRAAEGIAAYREWKARRATLIAQGSRPRHEIFAVTQAAEAPPDFEFPLELVAIERSERRPSGRRFGTLVHAVLRDVALDGARTDIDAMAAVHARVLGAPPEETEAAAEAVARALAHPLLARARAAPRLHREYPIVFRLDGGRILEGVLDLIFLEQGAWHIVDFKTDADLLARRDYYERQLRWYGLALSRLTGLPARGWLLAV